MKTALVAFTQRGADLALKIAKAFPGSDIFASGQHAHGRVTQINETLHEWTKQAFEKYDGIIFVGACGIAVRAIAPYIRSKMEDPAVVVVDERGEYTIALLSGHVGGANDLAKKAAEAIGATAVITTATDINQVFSVDSWAAQNDMVITNPECIKDISGALLAGKPVGLRSEFPVDGCLPEGLTEEGTPDRGIFIAPYAGEYPWEKTLLLVPKLLHLGVGCRRGSSQTQIETAVQIVFEENEIAMKSVRSVSSIDLKAEEPGLLEFCERHTLPLHTYSAEQLNEVDTEVNASGFVKKVTGADNVCERAALRAAGEDAALIVSKSIVGPVTVAVASEKRTITFEA